jgi:hypothetical protein
VAVPRGQPHVQRHDHRAVLALEGVVKIPAITTTPLPGAKEPVGDAGVLCNALPVLDQRAPAAPETPWLVAVASHLVLKSPGKVGAPVRRSPEQGEEAEDPGAHQGHGP